jgi:nicotinamidase-related amidase
MQINKNDTGVVFTDPQNDVLRDTSAAWGILKDNLRENNTIENMERILATAKKGGFEVFISPHYYFPTDSKWKHRDPLGAFMHENKMFERSGPLSLEGFAGSGPDWLDRLKPYIEDGKTVVTSPHKIYGPQTNDLILQLRKRGINKIILGGMLGNMCVESHLRHLIENGFEVAVAKDAIAAPRHPKWGDGYQAALTNINFLANAVMSTEEVVYAMGGGGPA